MLKVNLFVSFDLFADLGEIKGKSTLDVDGWQNQQAAKPCSGTRNPLVHDVADFGGERDRVNAEDKEEGRDL